MTEELARVRASHHNSPLRYPGGKAKLSPYMKHVIRHNNLLDSTYLEPFAGGAAVGLTLLFHGYVNKIILNDLSIPIYSFWKAAVESSDVFAEKILSVPLTVKEWERQREIFRASDSNDTFDLGFAAFYLNRTNRSGVLNGGVIGGPNQDSSYGIDARFNRPELAARIRRISRYRSRIILENLDALSLLDKFSMRDDEKIFAYIDPPYFRKGRDLYYDFYKSDDHRQLRDKISILPKHISWVVSYDNEKEIASLYEKYRALEYNLSYSVRNGRSGQELMFFSPDLLMPPLEAGGLQETTAAA